MNGPTGPARTRRRTIARRLVVAIGVCLGLAFQWSLVVIPAIEVEQFDRRALELERGSRWRYGYALQRHGAVLVKAPLDAETPPFVPLEENPISTFMTRELQSKPRRAVFEIGLYTGLVALFRRGLLGAPWLDLPPQGRLRWTLGPLFATVVFVTAAMAPYLVAGYGEPLFSTLRGPGAISSSGIVPSTAPLIPAVSYGMLLQAWLLWPIMTSQWAAEPLSAWLGIRASLWFVAAMFYGLLVASCAWLGWVPPRPSESG